MRVLSLIKFPSFPKQGEVFSCAISVRIILSLILGWASLVLKTDYPLILILTASFFYALLFVGVEKMVKTYLALLIIWIFFLVLMKALSYLPVLGMYFKGSLSSLSIPFLRMGIAFNGAISLAFSSSFSNIIKELSLIKLPYFILIPLTVSLRFLPTFFKDIQQIREINLLRNDGGSFLKEMLHPIKFWRNFCVPLIFRALHSSDALAISASLKGVGRKGGLKEVKHSQWGKKEIIILLLWGCILGGAFYWQSIILLASKGKGMHFG